MLKGILGFVLFIFFVFVFIVILIGGRIYSAFQKAKKAARRTQTATGETIIDNRHQERENKKIFDDSDGEYVEFEEA